jgi:chemotaxis protein CheD
MSAATIVPESGTRGRVVVIGMGELVVSTDRAATLITYALGSCLGVTLYDPVAGVAGMLHAMLPCSEMNAARAEARPSLFVDTGLPALFRACYAQGARKDRLVVKLAGAGALKGGDMDQFRIGKRNLLMARQLLWKNSVLLQGHDVGGSAWRTMSLHVGSGRVAVRSNAGTIQL